LNTKHLKFIEKIVHDPAVNWMQIHQGASK